MEDRNQQTPRFCAEKNHAVLQGWYTTEEYEYTAKAGVIKVPMPAFGAMVLYHKCENPTIFVEEEN